MSNIFSHKLSSIASFIEKGNEEADYKLHIIINEKNTTKTEVVKFDSEIGARAYQMFAHNFDKTIEYKNKTEEYRDSGFTDDFGVHME
tara:strand:+ start:2139 stop:2402 length:264 start_codon:yes stop_codon:yes gene_type:complete